jgi:hypothetical protein
MMDIFYSLVVCVCVCVRVCVWEEGQTHDSEIKSLMLYRLSSLTEKTQFS